MKLMKQVFNDILTGACILCTLFFVYYIFYLLLDIFLIVPKLFVFLILFITVSYIIGILARKIIKE
jgi:hypothetical protein